MFGGYQLVNCNKLLAIAIPTFNRAKALDDLLRNLIPAVSDLDIAIHILDNASSDETATIFKNWSLVYKNIFYFKNSVTIGMDGNFEAALREPKSEYVWLLGDTYIASKHDIQLVMAEIITADQKPDAILVDVERRVSYLKKQDFRNCDELLSKLGWQATCISANIFSKKIIDCGDFSRFRNTDLVHVGVLFESLARFDFLVKWMPEVNIRVSSSKRNVTNGWITRALNIWLVKWPGLIYSLPPIYSIATKKKCIIDHNRKSNLMTTVGLLNLRVSGGLNLQNVLKYRNELRDFVLIPFIFILFISVLPIPALSFLRKRYLNLRDANH